MERIAVIGFGNIANRHRRNLKYLFPNATLYGMSSSSRTPDTNISDVDQIVSNIGELIRLRVQLVVIASPAPYHAGHAIPLIRAKIPVLIEKPVTADSDDIVSLQHAIINNDTPVAVGYCLRYLSSTQEIKKLINSNKVGQLHYVNIEAGQYLPDWRPNKDYRSTVSAQKRLGGGALLELSHEIDYASWILGSLSLEHAILRSSDELGLDVEDMADMIFSSDNGVVVNMHLDFLQRPAFRKCRFVGSEGALEWDLIANEIKISSVNRNGLIFSDPTWDQNEMYLRMLIDFIEVAEGKPNSLASLGEASTTISLVEEAKARFESPPISDDMCSR